jgi:P27 family predicted phage terminase small subunit
MVKGRKPQATAIKEASGAFIKDPQRRNKSEPEAKRGWPIAPKHVMSDAIAFECWTNVCTTLDELAILTTADQSLMALYCSTYSQWLWLAETVKDGNCSVTNVQGNVTTSPEAQQVHKYADRLLKMMSELGLTPSSRSRLHVKKDEETDPFQEWLKGSDDN